MKTNKNNKYNSRIKSRTHTHSKQEKSKRTLIILGIILFIGFIVFLLNIIQIPYTESISYTESEPYQTKEFYYEQEPYQTNEYYNEQVSTSNCDYSTNCYCVHNSWLGLGNCDSCICRKQRIITKYQEVQKTRTITAYQDVRKTKEEIRYCALINRMVGYC